MMLHLLGWLSMIVGCGAGVVGVIVFFKGMISSLWAESDDIMMRLMEAFFGGMIGGLSCAGLCALGATLLGWQ